MARKIFNLERDLKTSTCIVRKVRDQKVYAQNLYAALCNNDFAPKDTWAILSNMTWNCSWLQARELISEIRDNNDFISWSGHVMFDRIGFVEESYVTPEVGKDIDRIGWLVLTHRWIE
jgi:hypothetical protein